MYIEHPYYYDGKYYAHVDGEMIEISREVAYAMKNFRRRCRPKKVKVRDRHGEVVSKRVREVSISTRISDDKEFTVEDFPDLICDVESGVIEKVEREEVHQVIGKLNEEERMIIYAIYFEEKTQVELAKTMGISRQKLSYKLRNIINKMRLIYRKK
jgi:RNA polymerase sigma factor (sigma-70 family)